MTRRKLEVLGMDAGDVRGRLRRGTLLLAAPGVYYVGHRSDAPGQREAVALAAAGPGAHLAGPTATGWIGMTERVAGPVHLIVGHARGLDPHVGVTRHVAELLAEDRSRVRGLPCVTPARAVMDLPRDLLRQALQWLMQRAIALEPIVERMHGRRGVKAFREEVAQLVPQLAHTMSELEARFVRLCKRHGVPLPQVNRTRAGGDLLDCTWPDSPLVVELDGRRWHQHRDREDRARDRRRILEGRVTLRYGWSDVTRTPQRTMAEVRAVLSR